MLGIRDEPDAGQRGAAGEAWAEHFRPPRLGPPPNQLGPRASELLDELEQIFLDEGFAHLTVGQLAARLKCSRSTLYQLAPTKDELVLVVLDRMLRSIGRVAVTELNRVDDPADRLDAWFVHNTLAIRRITTRLAADATRNPAVRALFASYYRYTTAVVSSLVDEGIARGRFRAVHSRVAAEVIDAALQRFWDPDLLRETGLDWDEIVAEISSLMRYGLLGAPSQDADTTDTTVRQLSRDRS